MLIGQPIAGLTDARTAHPAAGAACGSRRSPRLAPAHPRARERLRCRRRTRAPRRAARQPSDDSLERWGPKCDGITRGELAAFDSAQLGPRPLIFLETQLQRTTANVFNRSPERLGTPLPVGLGGHPT